MKSTRIIVSFHSDSIRLLQLIWTGSDKKARFWNGQFGALYPQQIRTNGGNCRGGGNLKNPVMRAPYVSGSFRSCLKPL